MAEAERSRASRILTDQLLRRRRGVGPSSSTVALRQSGEEGTLLGVLADLAERGTAVALHTRAARSLRSSVRFLARLRSGLLGPQGDPTYVPLRGADRRPDLKPARASVGDRSDRWGTSLHAALTELAIDRPTVALYTVGGDRIPGRLWTVGRDLVAVRGGTGTESYVPLGAVNDVALT